MASRKRRFRLWLEAGFETEFSSGASNRRSSTRWQLVAAFMIEIAAGLVLLVIAWLLS
jgi:hypothetical protein